MAIKNITCCKNCTKRHPCCHDTCEEYQKQKTELAESKSRAKHFAQETNYAKFHIQSKRVIRAIKHKTKS